jgi:HAD superfamily hydrolase (TIGR01450 family)
MKLLWDIIKNTEAFPIVRERLRNKELYILDLDGTVYVDQQPIRGAIDFIRWIREHGKQYVFLTNNSSKSSETYMNKIRSIGFDLEKRNLFTSNMATISFLNREFPNKKVLFLGTLDAAEEYKKSGIDVYLPFDRNREIDFEVAVLGYDTGLTYEKLKNFCYVLRNNAFFISTHPDINCPSQEGPLPDNGSMMELLYASTGKKPDLVLGKPRIEMLQILLEQFGCKESETVIIGDRLYTDIRMGFDNGVDTLLVLSGETTADDISAEKLMTNPVSILPDFVAHSLSEVYEIIKTREEENGT